MKNLHYNVYDVETPRQRFQTQRVDVLVKNTAQGSEAEAQGETLGPNVVRHELNGVADSQSGPCCPSHSVEEKDHGDDSDTCRRGLGSGVDSAACCPHAEGDQHAEAGNHEELSAADAIDEEGGNEGDKPTPDGETTVDVRLGDGTRIIPC